ncbi:hypothetical protein UlMin_035480 [Ulmus minor]
MAGFGGKGVGQVVAGFGSSGLGKALATVVAAFLLRLFSGPGPELSPEMEAEDNDIEHQNDTNATVNDKVYPVTIRWRNITCSLSDKSSTSVQCLLKNLGGEAKSGRLLAIMGPSGSGKTTLLNVLVGQVMASPRLHLSGLWEVNGKTSSNKAYNIVFGILFILLCLLYMLFQVCFCETGGLVFLIADCAGELQLPEIATVKARDEYVNNLLFKMGLVNCADSIVGDAKVRGINGGKKKRLSVACELIASPSVIFADEPTTGMQPFKVYFSIFCRTWRMGRSHTIIQDRMGLLQMIKLSKKFFDSMNEDGLCPLSILASKLVSALPLGR